MINIIGGKFKRAKLEIPKKDVRPTSSIKREAIFSILESYANKNEIEIYNDKCFIDLFAGSGSMGLEAVSRGVEFSYFFENNNETISILRKNCNKLAKDKCIIKEVDLENINTFEIDFLASIIFMDPPYYINPFEKILNDLLKKKIINKNTIIILEMAKNTKFNMNPELSIFNNKIYGKSKILFLKKL